MTSPDPLELAIEAAWMAAQNNGWRSRTDATIYAVDRVAVGAMVRAAAPIIAAQARQEMTSPITPKIPPWNPPVRSPIKPQPSPNGPQKPK